jgi:hypothetical protein
VIRHLKSLLGSTPEFHSILDKAQTLSALQQHFIAVAPPYLAEASMVIGLQFGTLSIASANATVAAKLRQLAPELTALLKNRGCEVSGIRVKVQVSYRYTPPKAAQRKLGKSAQHALQELSATLEKDSPLRIAVENMTKK